MVIDISGCVTKSKCSVDLNQIETQWRYSDQTMSNVIDKLIDTLIENGASEVEIRYAEKP